MARRSGGLHGLRARGGVLGGGGRAGLVRGRRGTPCPQRRLVRGREGHLARHETTRPNRLRPQGTCCATSLGPTGGPGPTAPTEARTRAACTRNSSKVTTRGLGRMGSGRCPRAPVTTECELNLCLKQPDINLQKLSRMSSRDWHLGKEFVHGREKLTMVFYDLKHVLIDHDQGQ